MKRLKNQIALVCLLLGVLSFTSCKKDVTLPILTTNAATSITINSVTSGGDITKNGGADVTERGVCWSTSRNPVISGTHSTSGTGTGSFSVNITGLSPNTQYYIRAYATNSAGTGYGNEITFTTTALVMPTLTTTAVSAISFTTAVSGGDITADGGASVTARGVCWSETADPTTDNEKTSDGTGNGTFTSNLTGLTAGTTYHVRAYATNSVGTSYGDDVTFTASSLAVPDLTTTEITAITMTSASSGGNITSSGGSDITVRGVCWAKTENPTTANFKSASGTGTGVFTSELTGLEPGMTYYVRSYATNSTGTAYGNEISFDTAPVGVAVLTTTGISSLSYTTAVSGGVITSDGGGAVTARGVCWSATPNPTTAGSKTSNGAGTGTFTSNITGLLPGMTYYVKAYAINSAGTSYGEEVTFMTLSVGNPVLTTTAITSLTMNSAVSGGNVTSDGGGAVTARGVCWSTSSNPTTAGNKTTNGTGTGSFASSITGLTPSTIYYVRAYATNSAGTAYGNELQFTTSSAVMPVLSTVAVTSITLTTASSGGNITSDGGAAITEKGVCWATTESPTILNSKTSDGSGTASFASSLTGLTPGATYHVRAYATNSAGTAYGNDIQFSTTALVLATLTTVQVSSITTTSAVSGGTISSNGGAPVTASGLCWSKVSNPTTADNITTDGTASGTFGSTMTGLEMGTTYYVRAYATNSVGTGYGNQMTFSTRVSDIDGNTYGVVTIGTQVWMTENLRVTTLSSGTPVPNVTDNTAWTALSTMAYSWYNNDAANKPVYGALYNWFAVNEGNLCPTGWHVPAETEFSTLELYLGMDPAVINDGWVFRGTDQGTQLKSTTGWLSGQNGTNTSGFTALPGGYRYAIDGTFNNFSDLAYIWSSTELDATQAWYRRLDGTETGVFKGAVDKRGGKYVRCVKN